MDLLYKETEHQLSANEQPSFMGMTLSPTMIKMALARIPDADIDKMIAFSELLSRTYREQLAALTEENDIR